MYQELATFFQVLLIICSILVAFALYLIVRDFLWKKRTIFKILLFLQACCSLGCTLIEAIAPNETFAVRVGFDKLPVNPNLVPVVVFGSSFFFYEYCVVYTMSLYLRAMSIIKLRPKFEQYILKFGVTITVILYQTACIFFFLHYGFGYEYFDFYNVGNAAGFVYFVVDLYFLLNFISYVNGNAKSGKNVIKDDKLSIIGKHGIGLSVMNLLTLLAGIPSGILNIPILQAIVSIFVAIATSIDVLIFVKMTYALKENVGAPRSSKWPSSVNKAPFTNESDIKSASTPTNKSVVNSAIASH